MLKLNSSKIIAAIAGLICVPAIAQAANFDQLILAASSGNDSRTVTGHTGGSYLLSAIANRDRHNNPCVGFAAPTPDHTMVLEQDFSTLKLQVNSGGKDTTLVVQGPDNTVLCGDDTGSNKDASIEDTNWKKGTYKIWVGSFEPSKRWNYTLSAQE
ncbi:hypothetical protein [Oscillatoria salina]|uniref:hypothetical protein n=1 Tax=Oscillatoria salina TaxID=331517 RepID=UPI0013B9023D|nr:hypothetical protein [Oscillatoria salina]MBZ8182618.1 hypothetical protein [Oscillatoria salina IIICB1]NET87414.1 hypothetical protein [Kamptonema sp. SIO1D9]